MTSIDTSGLDQMTAIFQNLPVEQQLAVLGMLFQEVSGSIPVNALNSEPIMPLVKQIQEQRQDEQFQTLCDFLSNETEAVALDPHPSKALVELLPGNKSALERYQELDANSRLAAWYQFGQQFGSIPSDFTLSSDASECLTALRSLGIEQQAAFLSQITQ